MFGEKYDTMRLSTYKNASVSALLMAEEFITPTVQVKINKINDYECLIGLAEKNNWDSSIVLKRIMKPYIAVIVTDLNKSIIWVNSYFETMTGYSSNEVLNRNPKFLQGKQTNNITLNTIRKNINQKKGFRGTLINYKKSGEPYDCKVEILPIFDSFGNHVHYIAFETDK